MYSAPEASLISEADNEPEVASRGKRLLASIVDAILIVLLTSPFIYFTGGYEQLFQGIDPSFGYSLAIGLFGMFAFMGVNYKLLSTNGQTVGKKVCGIKIVDLDNELPEFKKHILVRYLIYFMPGQVPIVGQLISMANILLIFGREKKCGHDYLAKTKVVIC